MNQQEGQTSILIKIQPYLPKLEKALIGLVALGVVTNYVNPAGFSVVIVGLGLLAVVYFLFSFSRVDFERDEDDRDESAYAHLFTYTIAPKTLWMGSAISLFGILLYLLKQPDDRHIRTIMIGGPTIAICLAIWAYAAVTGARHLRYFIPILYRAVPCSSLMCIFSLIGESNLMFAGTYLSPAPHCLLLNRLLLTAHFLPLPIA